MSSETVGGRVRVPVRLDRYLATIDVPEALSSSTRSLFADHVRTDTEVVGALIVVDDGGRITVDGRQWDGGQDQTVFDQLIYVLLQASLDADPDRLHLHAGLVSRSGRGLLIGGHAGCGKSTLVAQLIRAGFDYHTDERVAVDDALLLGPLPKPLSVVAGSFPVLADFDPTATGHGVTSPRLWHVPASVIRPGAVRMSPPELAGIVLVEYRNGAALESAEMHPITVARVLLADSIDVDRYGSRGPLLVTRLCASVPCRSVIHGGGADVAGFLSGFVSGLDPFVGTEVMPILANPDSRPALGTPAPVNLRSVLGPASGIAGAAAADWALIRTESGTLVELDEGQTAWFQLLDGQTALSVLVREVAESIGVDEHSVGASAVMVLNGLVALGVAA